MLYEFDIKIQQFLKIQKSMIQQAADQRPEVQEEKNYARRSRKDEEGRDYVCGCGKSYLSYPALYTHIKTKHDGQKPQGTLKVNTTTNISRKISSNPQGHPSIQTLPMPAIKNPANSQQSHPHQNEKFRLAVPILNLLEELTTFADFNTVSILAEISPLTLGYTKVDNRLHPDKVGEPIYEKYLEIVQITDQGKLEKIGSKSQLELIMVIYLIGVGRFVEQPVMDIYMLFCRLFRDCYAEHGTQIYQILYKNKEQPHREPHRDDPYKNYEYSYLPSSSKSKSYQSVSLVGTSSIGHHHHHHQFPNILINIRQSKYCAIIVDFFARVYIQNMENNEFLRSVLVFLCFDFCTWMAVRKITLVEVVAFAKSQIKDQQYYKQLLLDYKTSQLHQAPPPPKKQPSPPPKSRKPPQKQKATLTPTPKQNKASSQIQQQESQQQDEVDPLQDEDSINYKIGHQIAQELGARDRSGSIHHYVNGHEGQQNQQEDRVEGEGNRNIDDEEIQQYINT